VCPPAPGILWSLRTVLRSQRARGDSRDPDAGPNVMSDDRSCANHCSRADSDAAEDDGSRAKRRPALHDRLQELPIGLGLKSPGSRGRAWELVVHKKNAVSNEDFVLDRNASTDERMTLYLAVGSNRDSPLDLDERADARAVADHAAVDVRKGMNDHAAPEVDVVEQSVHSRVRGAGASGQLGYAPFSVQ
jgi:hypothetical protein